MAFQKKYQTSGVTTGTTAVTVIPVPSGTSFVYRLESLIITNKDTVDGVVIINVDDNSTSREVQRSSLNAGVAASGVLTFSGNAVDAESLLIGNKTYTWEAALSNVDGRIDVGVNQATSQANLTAAIDLGAGSGSAYAAAMTAHPSVDAADTGSTVVATAIATGSAGNAIVTTEAMTNGSWGAGTLTGGVDADSVAMLTPIILDDTDQSLQIVLGWPVITTEFDWVVTYTRELRDSQ